MGKTVGGLRLLREGLEAENSGVSIPTKIRWLSRAKAQARFQELKDGTSSVVAAVLGDATFNRVCKRGVRLFGRRYEVEAFEEDRLDAFCNRCSRWGHIAPHCSAAPRCSICAEEHITQDHRCTVEGCRAGRGRRCPHTTTRCATCRGPHGARVDACAAKKEARQLAWRWRSPPRPRREKGATAPEAPEYETPVAQGEEDEGKAEVEEGGRRTDSDCHGDGGVRSGGPVFSFPFVCRLVRVSFSFVRRLWGEGVRVAPA